jgi:hypothetical protein
MPILREKRKAAGYKVGEVTVSFRVTLADRPELIDYVRKKLAKMNYKLNSIREWKTE